MIWQSHPWVYILRKQLIQKDTCTSVFIAALFTIAKTWKQTKCPSAEEWVKMSHRSTMEYYTIIKRTKIESFAEMRLELKIVI